MIYVRSKIGETHLVPDVLHPDYYRLASDDAPRQDGPAGKPSREVFKSGNRDEVASVTAAPRSCEGDAGCWGGEETCNPEGSGQPPRPIFYGIETTLVINKDLAKRLVEDEDAD